MAPKMTTAAAIEGLKHNIEGIGILNNSMATG
jgi:hypothetical protein